MHRREVAALRVLEVREESIREWMQAVATLIRSNSDIAGGSLMSRVRRAVSGCAVLDGLMHNTGSSVTPQAVRDWVHNEVRNCLRWWSPTRLADDQTDEVDGEFNFTSSEEEQDADL